MRDGISQGSAETRDADGRRGRRRCPDDRRGLGSTDVSRQSRCYRSEAVFAREREQIWLRTWLYLGHETEIANPNDFKVRTIAAVR